MWKQLIAPTLVVAGIWLIVSPASTYFTLWLDEEYNQALKRNLTALHAAGEIREDAWRVLSYANSAQHEREDFLRILPLMAERTDAALEQLRSVAVSPEEKPLIDRLHKNWQELFSEIQVVNGTTDRMRMGSRYRQLREHARIINSTANEIRQVNERLWQAAERQRDHWKEIIITTRFIVVVIGPAIGIALGWWISKRVHVSISQINVFLKDATVEWDRTVAALRISGREDLTELRQRVERVVERLREVNAELDASRRESLRAERLAAVGQLAAGVAHELRNPLTSVKLLLQHAAQQPQKTQLNDEETCVILDEISRMENTIQGLLDFSRPPSSHPQLHDFCETLQRGLNLVQGRARQDSVQIRMVVPDHPVLVDGDPEQLHQVCVNLLINGIEADSGGNLEIHVEEDDKDQLIRVRFRDFGPGLANHVKTHLFEPFVSTKGRGTGLGLAISRRIVMQHGGSLIAENHPDGGAVFTLELPSAANRHEQKRCAIRDPERVTAAES